MLKLLRKRKEPPAERLLALREHAGDDQKKHDHYHKVVNRYQKVVIKTYVWKRRFKFWSFLRMFN